MERRVHISGKLPPYPLWRYWMTLGQWDGEKEPLPQVKGRGGDWAVWWVEKEGGVHFDSLVSGLGNLVAHDTFQIRTSG